MLLIEPPDTMQFSLLIVVGWARLSGLGPLFQACTYEAPLQLHPVPSQNFLKGTRGRASFS